ncbi:MAG: ABC transporter ATP-binding protein [Pseudomonadales bacterium]
MTNALSIKQLRKSYENGFEALKGIDLEVKPGDFFALLGPNGAGKSTTIGIICSLVQKSGGTVKVFGHDIDTNFPMAKKQIGVVPQEFNFNHFEKVFDIVVTQAGYYGLPAKLARERAEKYLRLLSIWDKRNETGRMLSGGMKRRLMIARALVHEPKLLILDEPTAGVDIELRRSMWVFLQDINATGTTIILTTHYLEEAESLCRNIAIIDEGRIIQNSSMRELLQQSQTQTFVLDVRDEIAADVSLNGFDVKCNDAHTLEVAVERNTSLNGLFEQLSAQGLNVVSMRNKANRLEELFVSLVEGNNENASAST